MLARSPNRKRATEYLHASGAVPIAVIERDGVCSISTCSKITGTVAARWWTDKRIAARMTREARRLAGDRPGAEATAALTRSATVLKASLTPDDIAIARASAAVVRLDSMVEAMRRDGTLREFNARYKAGRAAALAQGRGFMGYCVAMARLKRALIPRLIGKSGEPMQGLFHQVFR